MKSDGERVMVYGSGGAGRSIFTSKTLAPVSRPVVRPENSLCLERGEHEPEWAYEARMSGNWKRAIPAAEAIATVVRYFEDRIDMDAAADRAIDAIQLLCGGIPFAQHMNRAEMVPINLPYIAEHVSVCADILGVDSKTEWRVMSELALAILNTLKD